MNKILREKAASIDKPLMELILNRIDELEASSGVKRTVFAACPNSFSVIRAALKAAKRNHAPIKFAATLNQVDLDGGYTGLNQHEFVATIRNEAEKLNVDSPVIIAIDHGGPWLKDIQKTGQWTLERAMGAVKKSFEAAIDAGYDLIHVDPTVDIDATEKSPIAIELVVDRTIALIVHAEQYRRTRKLPRMAYEVGTEEVHGGLADLNTFRKFLDLLKARLLRNNLADVWPCFVVGKVGTDLHTTEFDPKVARELTNIAKPFGSRIKGHYSDNVANPKDYPASGMGAANVGPEFTECEYDALVELESMQEHLFQSGRLVKPVQMKKVLWEAVIASGRWRKWLNKEENKDDFYANFPHRQEWLIKTGCRYIWEQDVVVAARSRLYQNLQSNGIDAQAIVESRIETAMDKYFNNFNLVGLNELL
jgi:D-tagatose-1,6-bisphosphate aldolase subunit GatZ/KbaZ